MGALSALEYAAMKILRFQGVRYRRPDAGELAAPPFDQIDNTLRQRLHGQSEVHFSQLTRPDPQAGDQHQHAHELHESWLEDGVAALDGEPSLYPYRIEATDGSVRRGLFALVGVGPSSEGDLRPHEHTVAKPLADRLALLEATRVDLEPVMLMAEDPDGDYEAMLAEDCHGEELVRAIDPLHGDTHVLLHPPSGERAQAYQDLLASRQAVIADGHHRTKVAQMFSQKHEPAEGTAACAKLAVLLSLASEDVVIDPIHRALMRDDVDLEAMIRRAKERSSFAGEGGKAFAEAVAAAPTPSVGVWISGSAPEIWTLDADDVPEDTPGRKAELPAILLQYQLFAAAGLSIENASDGTLAYRSDADDLWQMVSSGEATAGFWLPPMAPEAFALATAGGDVMPPKSTRFMPKLASGLVWSSHSGRTE